MSDRWLNGSNSESGILRKAKPQHTADAHLDDLLVFGYACKIFRDNGRASEIDHGKHLIPWMGDHSLKIDRYDVRATLSDIRQYEAPSGGYVDRMASLTPAEQRAEQLCEEERYHSLYNNDVEEEMYQDEALKRLHKERSSTYGQVAFDYDAKPTVTTETQVECTVSEEPDTPFRHNPKFYVPPDIEVPDSMKLHAVVEKTAKFIAAQGPQMEILIKAKQSNNPQFEFLNLNNRLYPYYKHVLNAIKHGFYPAEDEVKIDTPEESIPTQKSAETELPNVQYPSIVVPQLKYKPSADCSYTQLISKIKGVPIPTDDAEARNSPEINFANDATMQHIMDYRNKLILNAEQVCLKSSISSDKPASEAFTGRKPSAPLLATPVSMMARPSLPKAPLNSARVAPNTTAVEVKKISSGLMLAQCYNSETDEEDDEVSSEAPAVKESKQSKVVYDFPVPPSELRNIIDKTAAYVLKNGKEFEEILRTKNDARFAFLKYTDQYYKYYVHKVTGAICSAPISVKTDVNGKSQPPVDLKNNDMLASAPKVLSSVSFSIKPKDEGPSLKPTLLREASSDDEPDSPVASNPKLLTKPSVPECTLLPKESVPVALLPTPTSTASVPLLPTPVSEPKPNKPPVTSAIDEPPTNGKSRDAALDISDSSIRDAMIENALTNGTEANREAKRAEDRVKDRLAQVAREKLGQVNKDKQLQLERRKKAMAFLNQIKPVEIPKKVDKNDETSTEPPAEEGTAQVKETEIDTQPESNGHQIVDSDDSVLSVHSVHSSPERPTIFVNGGVVSDDDDSGSDERDRSEGRQKRRKQKRSRSRSKSSSSKRHKSKKSKHRHRSAKKSKSSRRESRSRSRSSDDERRRRRRRSSSRSHAKSSRDRDSAHHKSSSSSSKRSHHHNKNRD